METSQNVSSPFYHSSSFCKKYEEISNICERKEMNKQMAVEWDLEEMEEKPLYTIANNGFNKKNLYIRLIF